MTLPAFLLASADWHGLWKGCSRFRPAQNARWSWGLVLGMTAGYTLMAISLGLILSLVFFHQPVAWMMWLTGAYMATAGLCWFGLNALCWNQRAARLRANPALVTGLPRLKFRLFRWGLGLLYFVLIALFTPLAMLLTIENVRGELAWRSARAHLVAQGERLTFREILGPEVPSEQNAAAAPIFAAFFDYQYVPIDSGRNVRVVWRDTNAIERFEEQLKRPDRYLPMEGRDVPRTPKVNLDAWAEAYRKLAVSPQKDDPTWAAELKLPPASAEPAHVVLAGLSVANTQLAEVCAATARPRCQFPVHYDEAFDALLRHLATFKGITMALELRCAARLATGDTKAAFDDAQCTLRFAELAREEPLLISQLVRIAQGSIAVRTVWQGLADHRWNETQLAALQDQLAHMDYPSGMIHAFEGERACGIAAMERCVRAPGAISGQFNDDGMSKGLVRILALLPRALFRQNEIALARYHTQFLNRMRTAVSNAPRTGLAEAIKGTIDFADHETQERSTSPYCLIANRMLGSTARAIVKVSRAQTVVQLGVVACALERYRIKNGTFPEKLDDLVPAYLPKAPLDPMNLKPFRYQRADDGWFLLYSVGPDGKDDGGVFFVGKKSAAEEKDWTWPVPSRPELRRLF